ncbi:MAG TPA: tetratricopeptide repeat protein [Tepidisphaeraceae bacterium]|nr:tetratricopeptide repeat protein [Tepidisphaeraceae bacterium]
MTVEPIDPATFVKAVQPLLEARDLSGLCGLLKDRWTPRQITDLLSSNQCDVRKVAALALSLVGGRRCIGELARQLRDVDPIVNQMAEHALWSIWFRLGPPQANKELMHGLQCLNRREFDEAADHFTHAVEIAPDFAEPYNQRAIVHYLRERYDESIDDCRKTVELMPEHFGAWAGLGHCYAHLEQADEAIAAYERALVLNPHLDCVKQTIKELKGEG